MELTLRQHGPNDAELPDILGLMRAAFAYMDGVVDPPSSIHQMTLATLETRAKEAEIWTLGPPVLACVVLQIIPDALYIGKLSVAKDMRGQGLSRRLIGHAMSRARAFGVTSLELESRVELTDNHEVFLAMGFNEVARTSHPGFSKPTAITFRCPVVPA